MTATLIGYARCSTDKQDLTAQKQALADLGVAPDRIYMDKGLTGTNRARPGLDQAMAAVRKGDTLVVPKLDRLARSVPDARHIVNGAERSPIFGTIRCPIFGALRDSNPGGYPEAALLSSSFTGALSMPALRLLLSR